MGTLATKDMPKRKGSALDKAQFKEAFTKWMRTSMHAKERDRESRTRESNPFRPAGDGHLPLPPLVG